MLFFWRGRLLLTRYMVLIWEQKRSTVRITEGMTVDWDYIRMAATVAWITPIDRRMPPLRILTV